MVRIATHFYNCNLHENTQAKLFENRFNIVLEKIAQGPGVVGDYKIIVNSPDFQSLFPGFNVIEFKHDKTSVKYKSFFCEYEQTSDFWSTRRMSGHYKAIQQNCLLVIRSGVRFFCFTKETFMPLFEKSNVDRVTMRHSNGNGSGCYTRGRIIKIKDSSDVFNFIL